MNGQKGGASSPLFLMNGQIIGRGVVHIIFHDWTGTREGPRFHYFS